MQRYCTTHTSLIHIKITWHTPSTSTTKYTLPQRLVSHSTLSFTLTNCCSTSFSSWKLYIDGPNIKTMHQALIFLHCRGQVREISRRAGGKYARKLVWKFVFLKAYHIQLQPLPPRELEQMCARYRLMIDWQLSPHLVSGESTLHQVTRFKARSRIFLPVAQSWAALFCCRLAILASSLGWLVGNNSFISFYTPPPPPPTSKPSMNFDCSKLG